MRLGLIAGALSLAVALNVPLCPFALITRHPCPGCGITRASLALAQGHWHDALHFHPLSPVITPLFALLALHGSYNYVRKGQWRTFAASQHPLVTFGAIALGLSVIGIWLARFFGLFGGPVSV